MIRAGVIGNPVIHSQSPTLHYRFAKQQNCPIDYRKYSCSEKDFKACVLALKQQGLDGLSVTLPFKQQAFALANRYTPAAKASGVANALYFNTTGIIADNTDGSGLIADLTNKGIPLSGQRILILGAGGACQGILPSLAAKNPQTLVIYNRHRERAEKLLSAQQGCATIYPLQPNSKNFSFDLVINATSAGHFGLPPQIPNPQIYQETICYDLSYGPAAKEFLQAAKHAGAKRLIDGSGMLEQGAQQIFAYWQNPCNYINT